MTRLTIYPTLVIGLGGAGTTTVRYVKRRFLRTWNGTKPQDSEESGVGGLTDLPALLQLLVVDTDMPVNGATDEPLYFHEIAYEGRFDAARLVQNRKNHPYLDWWTWNEKELPLGYIHRGAKQTRPIGRLAFFRHYATFRRMLENGLNALQKEPSIQEAQERGFDVAQDQRLVFIVTSLCGGTGAGMFLDVAHCVAHYVGASATVIGMLLMPSVFEEEIQSALQRRRIKANAYAALKELNHFQWEPTFRVQYPSEQGAIPTTPRKPFNYVYLVERKDEQHRALSSIDNAAQAVAHVIALMCFSPLNAKILTMDVNVKEERKSISDSNAGTALAYSSFGVSAIVFPREGLRRYFEHRTALDAMDEIFPPDVAVEASGLYLSIRSWLEDEFKYYATMQRDQLDKDLKIGTGLWTNCLATLEDKLWEILRGQGLAAMEYSLRQMAPLSAGDEGRITPAEREARLDNQRCPITEATPPEPLGTLERVGKLNPLRRVGPDTIVEENERERQRKERALWERQNKLWTEFVEKVEGQAQSWLNNAAELRKKVDEAYGKTKKDMDDLEKQINPRSRDSARETSTYYDLETGAVDANVLDKFWTETKGSLESSSGDNVSPWDTILDNVTNCAYDAVIPPAGATGAFGASYPLDIVRQVLREDPALRDRLGKAFDIQSVVEVQYADGKRPANDRMNQLFQRVGPRAAVDGDTFPYSEADQEHTRLVTDPDSSGSKVYRQARKAYQHFTGVEADVSERVDACHLVHGLPVGQLDEIPEMRRQYDSPDFPKRTSHANPEWVDFADIYTEPGLGASEPHAIPGENSAGSPETDEGDRAGADKGQGGAPPAESPKPRAAAGPGTTIPPTRREPL